MFGSPAMSALVLSLFGVLAPIAAAVITVTTYRLYSPTVHTRRSTIKLVAVSMVLIFIGITATACIWATVPGDPAWSSIFTFVATIVCAIIAGNYIDQMMTRVNSHEQINHDNVKTIHAARSSAN